MKRNYTTPDRETQRRVSAQRRELLEEIEKADEAYAEAFNAYRDVLDALNAHHLSKLPEARALLMYLGQVYRTCSQNLRNLEGKK